MCDALLQTRTIEARKVAPAMTILQIFDDLNARCDKFEHYFPLYEKWFQKFVSKKPKILEIGVQFGGSTEMWLEYFGPGTSVVGVDINPQCSPSEGFEIITGDQGSTEFWKGFSARFGASYFDIIIDDGSHENAHQITTLIETYALLRNDGIYWCEDTHTSYYNGVRVKGGGLGSKDSFIEYTKTMVDLVNQKHTKFALGVGPTPDGPHVRPELLELFGDIQGVHFYDSVVVIEKGVPPEFRRVNSDKTKQPKIGAIGNPAPESFLL